MIYWSQGLHNRSTISLFLSMYFYIVIFYIIKIYFLINFNYLFQNSNNLFFIVENLVNYLIKKKIKIVKKLLFVKVGHPEIHYAR